MIQHPLCALTTIAKDCSVTKWTTRRCSVGIRPTLFFHISCAITLMAATQTTRTNGWRPRCCVNISASSRCPVRARIALGTVQFGLPYGIANRAGQVAHADVAAILAYARSAGVDTVDTAIAYGDSEKCLGDVGMQSWRVVSKLPPVPSACRNV